MRGASQWTRLRVGQYSAIPDMQPSRHTEVELISNTSDSTSPERPPEKTATGVTRCSSLMSSKIFVPKIAFRPHAHTTRRSVH